VISSVFVGLFFGCIYCMWDRVAAPENIV